MVLGRRDSCRPRGCRLGALTPRFPRTRAVGGFTLISSVASMAVFALTLTFAASALISGREMTHRARQALYATAILSSTLEQVRANPEPLHPGQELKVAMPETSLLPESRLVVRVDPADQPNLVRVTARIIWRTRPAPLAGRTLQRTLAVLMPRPEGDR